MATKNTHFIDRSVQGYIRERLYNIISLNDMCEESRRDSDALRGALDVLHHMDKVNTPSYVFLLNFIQWMETNFCGFSWEQQQSYMNFHDMMREDMERDGWLDGEN